MFLIQICKSYSVQKARYGLILVLKTYFFTLVNLAFLMTFIFKCDLKLTTKTSSNTYSIGTSFRRKDSPQHDQSDNDFQHVFSGAGFRIFSEVTVLKPGGPHILIYRSRSSRNRGRDGGGVIASWSARTLENVMDHMEFMVGFGKA